MTTQPGLWRLVGPADPVEGTALTTKRCGWFQLGITNQGGRAAAPCLRRVDWSRAKQFVSSMAVKTADETVACLLALRVQRLGKFGS